MTALVTEGFGGTGALTGKTPDVGPNNWAAGAGTSYTRSGGLLVPDGVNENDNLIDPGVSLTPIAFHMWITWTTSPGSGELGFIFRAADSANYLLLTIHSSGVNLWTKAGGYTNQRSRATDIRVANTTYRVDLFVAAEDIELYLNEGSGGGQRAIGQFPPGSIDSYKTNRICGLRSYCPNGSEDGGSRFDDYNIENWLP